MKPYETTFSLEFIIQKQILRECLLCETNLDEDIGINRWHIQLCKKHRLEYLDKQQKEILTKENVKKLKNWLQKMKKKK